MNPCVFCRIAAGDIPAQRVYEDDMAVAFRDLHPKAPVHLLVIPKKHISSLGELSPADDNLTAHLLRLLPELARREGLNGFRTIINTGKEGGQEVFHLHIHVLGGNPLPGF